MRNEMTNQVEQSEVLGSFVRRGIEGNCMACHQPISAHVNRLGHWLGCKAKGLDPDTPFRLIPERRATDRPSASDTVLTELGQGQLTAPEGSSRTMMRKRKTQAPRVVYIATQSAGSPKVDKLPPHDRMVFRLIRRARTQGMTRKALLTVMKAQAHTGRVDGAVRRLRLRRVLAVKTID